MNPVSDEQTGRGIEFKQIGDLDHLEAVTPLGVRLMLDSVDLAKQLNSNWQKPIGSGVVLCFKQSSPAQVDSVHETIVSAGFPSIKDPWDAFWGQRYASVKDPDGNQIDIFAELQ